MQIWECEEAMHKLLAGLELQGMSRSATYIAMALDALAPPPLIFDLGDLDTAITERFPPSHVTRSGPN